MYHGKLVVRPSPSPGSPRPSSPPLPPPRVPTDRFLPLAQLPSDYPFKPPEVYMLTPSGRFEVNKKICLSISSFHPYVLGSSRSRQPLSRLS